MAYKPSTSDALAVFQRRLARLEQIVSLKDSAGGTQYAQAVRKLQAAVATLQSAVATLDATVGRLDQVVADIQELQSKQGTSITDIQKLQDEQAEQLTKLESLTQQLQDYSDTHARLWQDLGSRVTQLEEKVAALGG